MFRQLILRAAFTLAVELGGAFPVDSAQADLILNYGYVFTSFSYNAENYYACSLSAGSYGVPGLAALSLFGFAGIAYRKRRLPG